MRKKKRKIWRPILFTLLLLVVVIGISALHGANYHKIQYEQYCSEWGIPSQIDEMDWLEPYTAAVVDDNLISFRMDSNGVVNITTMDEAGQVTGERFESLIKESAIRNMFFMEPYLIYQTGDQIIAYPFEENLGGDGNRRFGEPIFLTQDVLGLESCSSDPSRFLVYSRNAATLYKVAESGIMEDRTYISDKGITRARAEQVNGNFALVYYTDRSFVSSEGLTKNELILTDFDGNQTQQLTAVSSVLPITLVNLNILNNQELNESYVIYQEKRSDRGVTSYSLQKITLDPEDLAVVGQEEIETQIIGKTIESGYWDDTPYILTTGIYNARFTLGEPMHPGGKIPCTINPDIRKNMEFMNLVTLEGAMQAPENVHFFVSTYTNSVSPYLVRWGGYDYAFFKDVTAGSYGLMLSSNHPAYLEAHPIGAQNRTEGIGFALTAPVQVISSGIIHLWTEFLALFVALGLTALVLTRRDREMTKKHFFLYLGLYIVINIISVYRFHYAGGPVADAPGFINGPGAFLYVPLLVNAVTFGLITVLGRAKDYDEMVPIIYFILVDIFLINLIYIPFSQILTYLS